MNRFAAIESVLSAARPTPPRAAPFDAFNYMWLIGPAITLVVLGILAAVFLPLMRQAAQRRQLLATGVQAQARILSIQETGLRVNHQPQVAFVLEVHPAGAPAFQAQCKAIISMFSASRVQPGMTVSVRYDPQDPTRVAIEI